MRRLAAVAVALVAALGPTSTANAEYLPPADRQELIAATEEAFAVQGVCYSWSLVINDQQNGRRITDNYSRTGRPFPSCQREAHFTATVTWTSEYSESEDFASYNVRTVGLPAIRTDVTTASRLIDAPDDAVFEAMTALPGFVAESGAAPWLPLEVNTEPVPGAAPTNTPGSDWLRSNTGLLVILVGGLAASICFAFYYAYMAAVSKTERGRHSRPLQRHDNPDEIWR